LYLPFFGNVPICFDTPVLIFKKKKSQCFFQVPGSNPDLETGYLDLVFHGFPESLQANAGIGSEIRPQSLPSLSFPVNYSLTFIVREQGI
jgi:hypothetical protein